MGITRAELYEGGRALMKTRAFLGASQTMKLKPVTILRVERGACLVRTDDGKEKTLRFNELEPDEDWLDQRDKAEDDKRERLKREALLPVELLPEPKPSVYLVPDPPKPLTASLGELVAAKAVPAAKPTPPAPSQAAPEKLAGAPAVTGTYQKISTPPSPPAGSANDLSNEAKPGPWVTESHGPGSGAGQYTSAEDRAKLGQRVYEVRRSIRMSRNQLATKTRFSWTAIKTWEHGNNRPSEPAQKALCAALGVDESLFDLSAPLPVSTLPPFTGLKSGRPEKEDEANWQPAPPRWSSNLTPEEQYERSPIVSTAKERVMFGERLRGIRRLRGISSMELADQIETADSMVSFYERGINAPRPVVFRRMCQVLDVTGGVLLGTEPLPEDLRDAVMPRSRAGRPRKAAAQPEQPAQPLQSAQLTLVPTVPGSLAQSITPKPKPKPKTAPVTRPEPEPEPDLHVADDMISEVDAWLAVGERMLAPLRNELTSLNLALEPLLTRVDSMIEKREELTAKVHALEAMLARRKGVR